MGRTTGRFLLTLAATIMLLLSSAPSLVALAQDDSQTYATPVAEPSTQKVTTNSLQMAPANNGQNGTTLTASVDATPHWTRTFGWTIAKSADPTTVNLPDNSGDVTYTITLTKDGGTDAAWIDGTVSVTNGGAVATDSLAIAISVTNPPSTTPVGTGSADVNSHSVLAPGETFVYPFTVNVPVPSSPGAAYKVTANVTITNHSGHLGTGFGPNPSASFTWPASPELINNEVDVSDPNSLDSPWHFTGSDSVMYGKTFVCADAGVKGNTATIKQTGQSASASVTVTCTPPAPKYWCSPGFWAQNGANLKLPYTLTPTLLATPYSSIGGASLKAGAPANPTIGAVLKAPNTYGGPAFNSVANYLAGLNGWTGTQATGENCPINASGAWIAGS